MTGILVIDKPEGFTSHDVVAKLRGILKERRIGHTGTLDPMATGVLVILIGRATRAMSFAEQHEKQYIAGLRLGIETDTQDITGTVQQRFEKMASRDEVDAALQAFRGDIMQIPPMYSAIKVKGKKLYQIARAGGEVVRAPRSITVSELAIVDEVAEDYILKITCSKGTYVRTLCHDIGAKLGCGGVMSSLRRTLVGSFQLSHARTLEQLEAMPHEEIERTLFPVDTLFSEHPAYIATLGQEKRIRCGGAFSCDLPTGHYRVYNSDHAFLMLGEVIDGMMTTVKSFYEVAHDK